LDHLILFYFFITFCAGFLIFGSFLFYRILNKQKELNYFLIFYGTFTLISFLNLISTYLKINLKGDLYYFLRYLENPVVLILLLFTTPYFIHHLINDEKSKSKNIFIAIIAIILFVFNLLFIFVEPSKIENNWRILIKDVIFIAIILYCILIIAGYFKSLDDSDEKSLFRKIVFLLLLLLPAIISDTFFLEYIKFKFFPVVYVLIGLMFFNYYIKIIKESLQNSGSENLQINNKIFPKEKLASQYSLTAREIEVAELLIKGKAYLSIAEDLFISVNTVKSHSRKAYQKLNVGNRMELANLISRLTSPNVK